MGLFSWLFGKRTPVSRMGDETYDPKELMNKGYRWTGILLDNKTTGSSDAIYYDGKGTRKGSAKRAKRASLNDSDEKKDD